MNADKIIKKLQMYFKEKDSVSMVFLYGSLAANRAGIDSDIDIAIYFKPESNIVEWENWDFHSNDEQVIWNDIERVVKNNIELLVLNRAVPTIADAALRGRVVIIKDYNIYLDFLLRITSEAIDFRECVEEYWKQRERTKNALIT